MSEWKKLSEEETAGINKKEITVTVKGEASEVEGQGIVFSCPSCGTVSYIEGTSLILMCHACGNVFTQSRNVCGII